MPTDQTQSTGQGLQTSAKMLTLLIMPQLAPNSGITDLEFRGWCSMLSHLKSTCAKASWNPSCVFIDENEEGEVDELTQILLTEIMRVFPGLYTCTTKQQALAIRPRDTEKIPKTFQQIHAAMCEHKHLHGLALSYRWLPNMLEHRMHPIGQYYAMPNWYTNVAIDRSEVSLMEYFWPTPELRHQHWPPIDRAMVNDIVTKMSNRKRKS